MMYKAKKILLSWDTAAAVAAAVGVYVGLPSEISGQLLKDLLSTGISVLAIVFSIYFASMTFIISSSDDEFVHFLRQVDLYDRLIWIFRWTLFALLVALFTGLILYVLAAVGEGADTEAEATRHPVWFAVGFVFLFVYSMIASFLTTNDAIKYAKRRAEFIGITKGNSISEDTEQTGGSEQRRSPSNNGS